VADINEEAMREPVPARRDPYGEGWLVAVHSPYAKMNLRNLLGGALARLWTEQSARHLQRLIPSPYGVLSQEGGVAVNDMSADIPNQDWAMLAKEFFLS
jgi:hypothetical protein